MLALGAALFAAPWTASAQHGSGPLNEASYTLDVHVVLPRTLRMSAEVRYVHRATAPIAGLWWHVYPNAFRPGSLFLRTMPNAQHRGNSPGSMGTFALQAIGLDTGAALLDAPWPTTDDDATELYTPLPTPLRADQAITLRTRFEWTLPDSFARSGCGGDFCFVSQFFPKLAVLESNGQFAHFALHAQSEFYADFGRYELNVHAPTSVQVFGPGTLTRVSNTHHRFVVHRAHDIAFGFGPRLQTLSATTAISSPRDGEHQQISSRINVNIIHTSRDVATAHRALEAISRALPILERRYGLYPYRTLTVVVASQRAAGVGGMEYPGLITLDPDHPLTPRWVRTTEYVTVHELAHQWFYGVIASDEHQHPFLDEGLTEYATGVVMQELYGPLSLGNLGEVGLGFWAMQSAFAAISPDRGPLERSADSFGSFDAYAATVYRRTASLLHTIELQNPRATERALARYARDQRWRHPAPADLLAAFAAEPELSRAHAQLSHALASTSDSDFSAAIFQTDHISLRADGQPQEIVTVQTIGTQGQHARQRWNTTTSPSLTLRDTRTAIIDPDQHQALETHRINNAVSRSPRSSLWLLARMANILTWLLRWLGP
ncbi:MAG: M1 family metallopeptidase [Deltaproteobacteria bacterium]|nr:M1 family metallopeptidase [Deltaproteobacteria bacterium]